MSDTHPVRTHIIGATVASLLVALILWALGFVGVIARSLWSAVSWLGHGLAASVSLPMWLVLLGAGYALAVTTLRRRHPPASRRVDEEQSSLPARSAGAIPRRLDRLQTRVMRTMADADGGTITLDELADDVNTSRLRVDQAVEQLVAIGYLEFVRDVVNGPVIDVTRAGRDYLIAKGLA